MQRGLIIEDLPDAQEWLGRVLREAFPGIEVDTAATKAEALEKIDPDIDLALVDLRLPDGSGIEVLRAFNQQAPETICVVATIFDDDRHIFPALQAGARGYLLKERSRRELVAELSGIVSGKPPLSPHVARRLLQHFQSMDSGNDHNLAPREIEVLRLIGKGIKQGDIADMLNISRHTVAGYVKNIYRKLNISSRAEAALEAVRLGLL